MRGFEVNKGLKPEVSSTTHLSCNWTNLRKKKRGGEENWGKKKKR